MCELVIAGDFQASHKKKKIFLLTVATKGWSSDTHKVKSFMFGKSRVFLYPTIFVRRGPSSRCSANEPTLFPSPLERIQKSGCCRVWYILVYQGINIWSEEAKWKAFFFFFLNSHSLSLKRGTHDTCTTSVKHNQFIIIVYEGFVNPFHFLLRKEKISIWAKQTYSSTGITFTKLV